jgi:hypothetical protein
MGLNNKITQWLPVILTNGDDFKSPIIGVAWDDGDLTVRYKKHNQTTWSTKTLTVSNWIEGEDGHYSIQFLDTELDIVGLFEYKVVYVGAVTYPGLFHIDSNFYSGYAL